jgi:glutamine---fructose-6-phosphate transaminase (isomerizing)
MLKISMCGIIGYIGEKQALDILMKGLLRLEHRGYDSAGIAVLKNDEIKIMKAVGEIKNLEKLVSESSQDLSGKIGIAHTRWATHGRVTEANAHPQCSCNEDIVLVHNGIIENYLDLKKKLKKMGHKFSSETDTEVIAHLIEEYNKKSNFEESVRLALQELEGTYGLAIMHRGEKKIIGATNGSSLIVGKAKHGIFIASEASAFLEHTKNVNQLDDGQIAIIGKDYEIKDINNKKIPRKLRHLDMILTEIEKGGHPYFMHKEIFEQEGTVHNAFRGRLINYKGANPDIRIDGITEILDETPDFLKKLDRAILLACGTAWHASLYGEYIFESLALLSSKAEIASQFSCRNPVINENDFFIAVSQSGETMDMISAVKYIKERAKKEEKNIRTFGIVNVVGSKIARLVDSGVYTHSGPEIGVASTKAFTGQVTCLYLMALKIAKEKGILKDDKLKSFLQDIQEIPDKIKVILNEEQKIKDIAEKYQKSKHFLFLGADKNYPIALEGALKLAEIAYVPCRAYGSAEMKHGPLALVGDDMATLFVLPKDRHYEKNISNLQEIKARKGKIIAITTKDAKELSDMADDIIYVPNTNEYLMPLLSTIPLQFFAYHMAVSKGLNVDKPRNISKVVTTK